MFPYHQGERGIEPDEEKVDRQGDTVVLSSIGGVERDVAHGSGGSPEGLAGHHERQVGPR